MYFSFINASIFDDVPLYTCILFHNFSYSLFGMSRSGFEKWALQNDGSGALKTSVTRAPRLQSVSFAATFSQDLASYN